jgi:hypothetical protein
VPFIAIVALGKLKFYNDRTMAERSGLVRINCYLAQDNLDDKSMPRQLQGIPAENISLTFKRIVGLRSPVGHTEDPRFDGSDITRQTIHLPADTSERLLTVAEKIYTSGGHMTSGQFAQEVAGSPPCDQLILNRRSVRGLPAGVMGCVAMMNSRISPPRAGSTHSLVGLGARNPNGLQLLSGNPALAATTDVLTFYTEKHPGYTADLYRAHRI